MSGGLDSVQRIDGKQFCFSIKNPYGNFFSAAFEYLLSNVTKEIDKKEFEEACGIGVIVTPEQIEQSVEKAIKKHKENILEKR